MELQNDTEKKPDSQEVHAGEDIGNVKPKRKHRRGAKHKNSNKGRKFQNKARCERGGVNVFRCRYKDRRAQSLVPYNTNKFLMEEHMADFSSAKMTPQSTLQDEEAFLSKDFASVYEGARLERLEAMSKQQLIEECLTLEDRFSTEQRIRQEIQSTACRTENEYSVKIKTLEDRIRDLSKENNILRSEWLRTVVTAETVGSNILSTNCLDVSGMSEDSESDSSSSSSSMSCTCSSCSSDSNIIIEQDEVNSIMLPSTDSIPADQSVSHETAVLNQIRALSNVNELETNTAFGNNQNQQDHSESTIKPLLTSAQGLSLIEHKLDVDEQKLIGEI